LIFYLTDFFFTFDFRRLTFDTIMYSKQENQRLKQEFWIAFAQKYPRKWMLYDTKIKDFSFKFWVDNKSAQVIIDIEMRNEETRYAYFEKIEALKTILEEDHIADLVYHRNFTLESGKTISRILVEKSGVGVSKRDDWDTIFDFFNQNMDKIERLYLEFDEYIKDI
jgi:hypothetical protein